MKKSKEIREHSRLIKKQNAANKQLALQIARIEEMQAHKIDDPEKPKSRWKKLTALERALLFLFALVGALVSCYFIYDTFIKSPREKFEEDNTIQGDVKSPSISDNVSNEDTTTINTETHESIINRFNYDTSTYFFPIVRGVYVKGLSKMKKLIFQLGTNMLAFDVDKLYRGIGDLHMAMNFGCDDVDLVIIARDDRLYVSCKFIDLTGYEMGIMDFNHWKIYRGKFLDYYCTDTSFAVIDHQGYTAFSMAFIGGGQPFVSIKGYLNNPSDILILSDYGVGSSCISKSIADWKQQVEKKIKKISNTIKSKCD